MAKRQKLNAREAIEIILEDGSDEESDVLFSDDGERDPDYVVDDRSDRSRPILVDGPSHSRSRSSENDENETNEEEGDVNDRATNDPAPVQGPEPEVQLLFDDEDDGWQYTWVRNLPNFPINAPFSGTPGLTLPDDFPDEPTPTNFYRLFVDRDLITLIKVETNRYARKVCNEKKASGTIDGKPWSMFNQWTPVTLDEIQRFIVIAIHMGLVQKPRISDYWSLDPSVHSTFASRLMKRERFKAILAFFHLNNNELFIPAGYDGHDPLFKLRPLYDYLLAKFPAFYTPEENICIDEALCPWRGRSSLRVYMRDKPTKWGIKMYELCESKSGYVYNMEIYCRMPGLSNTPYDVCHRLMEPLRQKGYTLYVDNYYCNPALCESLSAENTQVVGTVRANRIGMQRDLTNQRLTPGGWDYRRWNNTVYVKWKDKRDVHILSTKHIPTMQEVQTRTERKRKPTCVADYTSNMAGVDKSDQMVAYLPLHRKTIKWYKKLVFHLLTLVMIQSHCPYNKYKQQRAAKQLQLDAFVKSVCDNFAAIPTTDDTEAPPTGAADPTAAADLTRLHPGNHWPQSIPLTNPEQTRKTQRGCKVCYARQQSRGATRKELKNKKHTSYQCQTCQVPLCIEPCFRIFHTVLEYGK